MAKGSVTPGICGLPTTITAEDKDGMMVALKLDSQCSAYQDFEAVLPEVNGMMVCFDKIGEGPIYEACKKTCKHAACPVPMAIIKTVEVAAGMALPKDVAVALEK